MAPLDYLQFVAGFLWLVLAGGWTLTAVNRRAERLRRTALAAPRSSSSSSSSSSSNPARTSDAILNAVSRRSNGAAGSDSTDGNAHAVGGAAAAAVGGRLPMPPVAVIMPVKGCRPHSEANWRSQLEVEYGGPIEFVFVVEDAADPAVPVLRQLQQAYGSTAAASCDGAAVPVPYGGRHGGRAVWLEVAGAAESCSQKAHNLVSGIEAVGRRWAAQSAATTTTTAAKAAATAAPTASPAASRREAAPHAPASGAAAAAAAASAPDPLASGYLLCVDDDVELHPGTVQDLVEALEAAPDVWMATGYPFDVPPPRASLPAHLALAYHLPLLIAFSAAARTSFVWGGCMALRAAELLPGDPRGLLAAWRRGGYSDDLILASFCAARRLPILVPRFAIFPQRLDPRMSWAAWANYLHRQLFVLDTYVDEHNRRTNHTMMVLHSALSWATVLPTLAALVTIASRAASASAAAGAAFAALGSGSGSGGGATAGLAAASGAGGDAGAWRTPAGAGGATAAVAAALRAVPPGCWAVLGAWLCAHAALVCMAAEILRLFAALSPRRPRIPLSSYRWAAVWSGMLLSNLLLPGFMAYAYACPTVRWGGVLYRKRRGRVAPVRGLQ